MKRLLTAGFLALALFAIGASAQKNRLISDIQGEKNYSPYQNELARVYGIVTARVRNGFYMQTPDDKVDGNPNTSEGIFVFTSQEPPGAAAIGNYVSVTGVIEEFTPPADPNSFPITQIKMRRNTDVVTVESKDNPLPKPIVLTIKDFESNLIDQLEKYESMRVSAPELTAVTPTDGSTDEKTGKSQSNGRFVAVLKGIARPFRDPGFSIYDFIRMPDKEKEKFRKDKPKTTLFDHNPERLQIDTTAQLGAEPVDVTFNSIVRNVTGVVGYSYRTFSILVDPNSKPTVENMIKALALPAPNERFFSIAATNVERLMDDEDDPAIKESIITTEGLLNRFRKISMAVRLYMQTPEIIGVVEVENLAVLKRLAEHINKDAEAAGKPNPKYEAFLVEGNDLGGIDSGFLVKTARVEVLETKQFGKDEKMRHPRTKDELPSNDRPPFMLRAAIRDDKTGKPFEVTVIVNHLKSFRGYEDPKDMEFVRLKKKLQAEFLAKFVGERLKANPEERIALVGDFNFYQFSDGIMDVIGTIKGTPASADSVLIPMDDFVNPDLTNLVDKIKEDTRYSYLFGGNAQVLDHFLISPALLKSARGFGFAHINVDFPEIYRNDPNRVERFSDHDAPVAFFSLD